MKDLKQSALEKHISKMGNKAEHYSVTLNQSCRTCPEHNRALQFCRCGYPGVGPGKVELHSIALEYEADKRKKK